MINARHGSLAGTATPLPTASPVKDDGVKSETPTPGTQTLTSPDDAVKILNLKLYTRNHVPEKRKNQKPKTKHGYLIDDETLDPDTLEP